jgi:hypothetical protein
MEHTCNLHCLGDLAVMCASLNDRGGTHHVAGALGLNHVWKIVRYRVERRDTPRVQAVGYWM